ncbi:hypothetical protein GALMADRAFT_632496 [Galerina marginata CBS 339.88]|uniref:Uncharacterized protein n=1 Tax=Galerina marginata (strain CBS 339.88) TaxID=685588 RepID=A0A067T1G4_GALM3|nr:hypothetical protein GALMADRAFT_632496 [Galerina marginata CBS 339.88]
MTSCKRLPAGKIKMKIIDNDVKNAIGIRIVIPSFYILFIAFNLKEHFDGWGASMLR